MIPRAVIPGHSPKSLTIKTSIRRALSDGQPRLMREIVDLVMKSSRHRRDSVEREVYAMGRRGLIKRILIADRAATLARSGTVWKYARNDETKGSQQA